LHGFASVCNSGKRIILKFFEKKLALFQIIDQFMKIINQLNKKIMEKKEIKDKALDALFLLNTRGKGNKDKAIELINQIYINL
jgi:hypothetical protein